jgi:hypothetical protein
MRKEAKAFVGRGRLLDGHPNVILSLHALDEPVRNPPVAAANSRALRTSTSSLEQQASRPASLRQLGEPPWYRDFERIVVGIGLRFLR